MRGEEKVSDSTVAQKGHLARDCPSPRRHTEENVATMNEVIHSGWLSE